jgi:hypothetical protein
MKLRKFQEAIEILLKLKFLDLGILWDIKILYYCGFMYLMI